MADPWKPGTFHVATIGLGAVEVDGYVWRGLGLHHLGWGEPRSMTEWTLTHLGSGGAIVHFQGDVRTVFPVASEIAECTDWTAFELPSQVAPIGQGLAGKVIAICRAHPEALPFRDAGVPPVTDTDAALVIRKGEGGSVVH